MRIHFVVTTFPQISQTFILKQMTGLIDLGVDISITANHVDHKQVRHPQVDEYRLLDRANQPGRVMRRFIGPHPGTPDQRLIPDLVTAVGGPFFRLFSKPQHYDAILCHFGPNGLCALSLKDLGRITGPLAVVFHGYDISQVPRTYGSEVYRRLFEEADLILPISDFWAGRLEAMGCPADKIHVHRMGIDLDRFVFHQRVAGEIFHFVSVCRFTEKKGLQYLIDAASRLKTRGAVRFRITIAGDGELRQSLIDYTENLGLGDTIAFPGTLRQPEVVALYDEADAFMAPSVTAANGDMEGIPVALMEAMASGLPVISTRHSGIPELIEDGVSGLLAEERDVAGLADAMMTLMSSEDLRNSLAVAGRHKVEQDFEAKYLNRALLNELTSLQSN